MAEDTEDQLDFDALLSTLEGGDPAEEAPADGALVEQAPVEEAPVEQAPVEQAPVEEAPALSVAEEVPAPTGDEMLSAVASNEQEDKIAALTAAFAKVPAPDPEDTGVEPTPEEVELEETRGIAADMLVAVEGGLRGATDAFIGGLSTIAGLPSDALDWAGQPTVMIRNTNGDMVYVTRDEAASYGFSGEGVVEGLIRTDFRSAVPETETIAGALTEGVVQFVATLIPVVGVTGKVGAVANMTGAARGLTNTVVADFLAFEGNEGRVSDMLNEMGLGNSVTELLSTDLSDSDFEGRLKNVTEGGIIGGALTATFRAVTAGLRYMRAANAANKGTGSPEEVAAALKELEEAETALKDSPETTGTPNADDDKAKAVFDEVYAEQQARLDESGWVDDAVDADEAVDAVGLDLDIKTTVVDGVDQVDIKGAGSSADDAVGLDLDMRFLDEDKVGLLTRDEVVAARMADAEAGVDVPGASPMVPLKPDAGVERLKADSPDRPIQQRLHGDTTSPAIPIDAADALDAVRRLNPAAIKNEGDLRRASQAIEALLRAESGMPARPQLETMTDVQLQDLAVKEGLTVDELINRTGASAESPEFQRAAQMMADGTETEVRELAAAALDGDIPNEMAYGVIQALDLARVARHQSDVLSTESGRILRLGTGDVTRWSPEAIEKLDSIKADLDPVTPAQVDEALASGRIPTTGTYAEQTLNLQMQNMSRGTKEEFRELLQMLVDTPTEAFAKALADVPQGRFSSYIELLASYQFWSMLSRLTTNVMNVGTTLASVGSGVPERYLAAFLGQSWGAVIPKRGPKIIKLKTGGTRKVPLAGDRVSITEANAMLSSTWSGIQTGWNEAAYVFRSGGKIVPDGTSFEATTALRKGLKDAPTVRTKPVDPQNLRQTEVEGLATTTGLPGTRRFTAEQRGLTGAEAKVYEFLGMVLNTTTIALSSSDAFFRGIARVQETVALSVRMVDAEGLTGEAAKLRQVEILNFPPKKLRDAATKFSREATFTEAATGPVKGVNNFIRDSNPLWQVAASATVPFMRTTMNLAKVAARRTPFGLAMQGVQADLKAGGARATIASTRMALGTFVGGGVVIGVNAGLITGSGPSDPALLATWKLSHEPYSMKIAGEWVSFENLQPFSTVLGAWATAAETLSYTDNEEVAEGVLNTVLQTGKFAAEATFIPAFSELLALTNGKNEGQTVKRLIAGLMAKQLAPGIYDTAVDLAGGGDTTWRMVDGFWDTVRSKIPGLSQDLPARRNLWGQPVDRDTLGPDGILPLYLGTHEAQPIDDWLWDNQVTVGLPGRIVTGLGHDAIELTTTEYSRYIELAGNGLAVLGSPKKGFYDFMNSVMAGNEGAFSRDWANGFDTSPEGAVGSRETMFNKIMEHYRAAALAEMRRVSPDMIARHEEALRITVEGQTGKYSDPDAEVDPDANPYLGQR